MYRAFVPAEMGGELNGDGGYGFEAGGGSPPFGSSGQPCQGGGGYGSPPGRPPEGGGGVLGWGAGANQPLAPQVGQQLLAVNGRLKSTTPAIFNGNRENTKQFSQEFSLYRMINQETGVMRNAYTRTALVLLFMRGPTINNWVLQQTERLFVRCNGDMMNGILPTHQTHDKWLWEDFGHDFQRVFADTASEQQAYGKLANYIMNNKSIDEYTAQFEHLLQKAGWDHTSQGSLFLLPLRRQPPLR